MLSARNSLNSTKEPLRILSTTFPGIGGRAGDIIRGGTLPGPAAVGGIDGSGVAKRVVSEGRLLVPDRGADKASGTGSVAGPPTARQEGDVVVLDSSGMVDIAAGGGGTKGATAVLAGRESPAGIHERGERALYA